MGRTNADGEANLQPGHYLAELFTPNARRRWSLACRIGRATGGRAMVAVGDDGAVQPAVVRFPPAR